MLSVQGRTQRAPTAPTALSNSSSQRAPTEQRRVGQQEASDGSEEEEEVGGWVLVGKGVLQQCTTEYSNSEFYTN